MNKKHLLLAALCLLPALSFASTGDTTFDSVVTELKGYVGGSLGLVFVFIGFIGAGAAVAGFAPMKVMFPVFGLTLALNYGPAILEKIFGASGMFEPLYMHHAADFTLVDLAMVLAAAAVFVIGRQDKKINLENQVSM